MVSGMRTYQEKRTQSLEARVSLVSDAARKILADWIQEHHRNVQILSTLVGDPNASTYDDMQHYVEIIKAATPAFRGMGVFNRDSITVSYSPLEQDGKPTVGVDMSARSHIAVMRRDKKPYITDVLMSKLGNPSPIVIFLAPVIIAGEYQGYCSGVVEVDHIFSLLRSLAAQGIHITVADGLNRVIVSTIPGLNTMDLFPRPYSEIGGTADSMPTLWKPDLKPNTSLMQQWRGAFFFHLEPLLESCSWKVIVEASCNPLIEDISRYSLSRLGLLGLLILCAVTVSHFLSNMFISSIVKLQVLTKSLPERFGNDANIEWPKSSIEELAELSNNFQDMAKALLHDMTERKQAEAALRVSEERFRSVVTLSPVPMGLVNRDGIMTFINDRHTQLFGYTSDDIPTISEWWQKAYPDGKYRDWAMEAWNAAADRAAFEGEVIGPGEHKVTCKDGTERVVEITGIRVGDETLACFIDLTERKKAEETLRRWADAFEYCAHGIAIGLPASNRIMACNPAFARMFATTPEDVAGSPILSVYAPSEHDHVYQCILEADRIGQVRYETLMQRKDGSIFPVQMDLVSVRDAEANVLYRVATLQDITERNQAMKALSDSLEEKVALLKEVHHRVKNNLQVVASLLGLQAGRSDNQQVVDVLQDTRNRVRSMALLHETLYRSGNLARINFATYLKDLCGQLLLSSGPVASRVTLEYHVAQIGLPLEQAVPCGLIVSELVSNALKHGFPGKHTGRIVVGLDPTGEQTLILSVRDEGVGLTSNFDSASTSTLGMQLVSGLAGQLGGQLEEDASWGPGAAFRVVFPVPKDTLIGGPS
jgi:PAS domain S-box-containing protein